MAIVQTFRCVRLARRKAIPTKIPTRVLSALAHTGARRVGPGVRDPGKFVDEFWKKASWDPTRYGDGKFAVLYSSLSKETSLREVFFHIDDKFLSAAPASSVPREDVTMGIFEIDLKGKRRSFEGEHFTDPDLVHPKNYKRCQDIGRASYNSFRFLRVPSARCIDGICTPSFSKKAISRIGSIDTFDFTYDTSTKLYVGDLGAGVFSVDIQDVHGYVMANP